MTRALVAGAVLLASAASGQQARTIRYTPNDIVAIRTKVRFTTLVVLPEGEKILDFVVGDKDFWVVEGADNMAYVKPAKEGAATNVQLITAAGNAYSLLVTEVGRGGGEPDLKVFIDTPRARVAEKRQDLPDAGKDEAEAKDPTTLRFEYRYQRDKKPFRVTMIYHDGRFTYIHCHAGEKPALYELQDGRPALINYELNDGVYVVPKILERGYLALGKSRFAFERKP